MPRPWYVRFYLSTCHQFQKAIQALPDFVDDLKMLETGLVSLAYILNCPSIISSSTCRSNKLTEQELHYAENLKNSYAPYKLRFPLHAALLLSPLSLLRDKLLMSRCMHQEDMMKVGFILLWQAVLSDAGLCPLL